MGEIRRQLHNEKILRDTAKNSKTEVEDTMIQGSVTELEKELQQIARQAVVDRDINRNAKARYSLMTAKMTEKEDLDHPALYGSSYRVSRSAYCVPIVAVLIIFAGLFSFSQ